MRAFELLGHLADNDRAGGVGELLELAQVLLARLSRAGALRRRADEDGTLDGGGESYRFFCDCPVPKKV